MKALLILVLILAVIPVTAQTERPPITPENVAQVIELDSYGRGRPSPLAWTPDSSKLVVGTTAGVWVYDDLDEAPRHIGPADVMVTEVAVHPDGDWLAAGTSDGEILFLDITTGDTLRTINAHPGYQLAPAFRAGRVWDLNFSPDGQWLVSGGADASAALWDVATGEELWRFEDEDPYREVTDIVFSSDGRHLAWSSAILSDAARSHLWLYDIEQETARFFMETYYVYDVGFLCEDQCLVALVPSDYEVWDIETGNIVVPDPYVDEFYWMTADGIWGVPYPKEERQYIHNVLTGRIIGSNDSGTGTLTNGYNYAVRPDETMVAYLESLTGYPGIFLTDLTTITEVAVLTDFTPRIAGFHTLTDNAMELVQGRGYFLSPAEGNPIFSINDGGFQSLAEPPAEPDLPMRAVPGDDDPEWLKTEQPVADIVYSPDGIHAAVITGFTGASTSGLYVWNNIEGKLAAILRQNWRHEYQIQVEEVIYDAAFSPDGGLLAVGTGVDCCILGSPYVSLGNAIVIYDVATGAELVRLHGHTDRVTDVEFSADGSILYSASWDGTVRVWGVPE